MPINQDTHYVIKNGIVEQPAVVKDGLELYYDAKGKHNNDVHKDTLLDLSGNNRHGTLVNFAYEGVSGYQENGTGGILLDDVDDKIVRPAIPNIQYTSASRNMWMIDKSWKLNKWSSGAAGGTDAEIVDNTVMYTRTKLKVTPSTQYVLSSKYATDIAMIVEFNSDNIVTASTPWVNTSHVFTTNANTTFLGIQMARAARTVLSLSDKASFNIQLEKAAVATAYTPYIPLPIMTYQMNGNILSFEKDGTVKRTTKDANGNEVVVSRKGINLARNGNFTNEVLTQWSGGYSRNAIVDGVMVNKSDGTGTSPALMQAVSPYSSGDVLYVSAVFNLPEDNTNCTRVLIEVRGSTSAGTGFSVFSATNPSRNEKTKIEGIIQPSGGAGLYHSMVRHLYDSNALSSNMVIEVYEFQLINLTQAYGAGNEPDLAYIQAHPEEFAWTPNPNDLIETVEIKNNLVGDLESLQGNDFEQHEDGVITYTNEAEAGSVVRVGIDGISDQPLRFRNATGEQVVITEHDQIDEDAIKKIEFQGNSVQLADKYREVSGTSVTIAPELHDKSVADKLVIGGNTTQYTESSNVVTDGLEMWLSGRNFSNSPATTVWKDLTGVNNGTASGFAFTSASGSDGNGGVVFDGVDDRVVFNSLNTLKNGQITCEMSLNVKNQKSSGWHSFFGGTLGFSLSIGILPTSFKLGATLTNHVDAQASAYTFQLNTDVHVAVTYSTFTKILKYYINGVLITTVNNAFSGAVPTGSTNEIGAHSSVGTGALDGNVKFARIYNRALTDAEVLQNYNAGLAIPIPNIAMPQEVKHVNSGSKVLVHGKNLVNSLNRINNPRTTSTHLDGIISATGTGDGVGVYLKHNSQIGETITLSYKFRKTSGTMVQFGGHSRLSQISYTVDGISYSSYHSSPVLNISDGLWHSVIYTFKVEAYSYLTNDWEHIGIEANRYNTNNLSVSFEIKDIQFERNSIATTYEPYIQAETTIPVTLKSIG